MAESQRETLRNQLVSEFSKIKVADGYRTNVELVLSYRPFTVENHPTIVVELVEEEVRFIDTQKTVANSDVRVRVWGHYRDRITGDILPTYAAESAGELLLHDMKTIMRALMIREVAPTDSPRFKIEEPIRITGPEYTASEVGWVLIEFRARILYQGSAW